MGSSSISFGCQIEYAVLNLTCREEKSLGLPRRINSPRGQPSVDNLLRSPETANERPLHRDPGSAWGNCGSQRSIKTKGPFSEIAAAMGNGPILFTMTSKTKICAFCTKPFEDKSASSKGGRPSTYCSNLCRQSAYRKRTRLYPDPEPNPVPVPPVEPRPEPQPVAQETLESTTGS